MKHILLAATAALALTACQTNPITPPSVDVAVLQADTSLDVAYNAAAQAYLAVLPSLTPAAHAEAKALLVKAYTAVQAADSAQKLGDATTLAAQIANAQSLIAQVQALLPAKK